MRAKIAHSAILATTILTLAGCKSGPRWNWWSSKDKASQEALVNAPGAPQLPSAAAATTAAAPSLNASSSNAQTGVAGGITQSYTGQMYPEQTAAATSYGAGGYPTTQTAEYTNPYVGGAPATSATAAMPNAINQPQQGAYSPHYQQPAQQSNPYADPFASRQMPAQDGYNSYGQAPPAGAAADQNYRTADNRSASTYDSRGADTQRSYDVSTEMSSPDYTRKEYGADTNSPAAPTGNANRYADQYQADPSYQPGTADYTPGNTGYTGPRSYENNTAAPPAGGAPNGAAPGAVEPRKDPGYRPAGTSDYMPSSRVGGSAGAGFSTGASAAPKSSSGVVTAGYHQGQGNEAATPARFQPQDNAPVSTLTIGRRSYE